jgi:hypothetical protein
MWLLQHILKRKQKKATAKPALVIVDVQTRFDGSDNAALLNSICQLIDQAIQEEWLIITLQYLVMGNLQPRIYQKLQGYKNWQSEFKQFYDGSGEVLTACQQAECQSPQFFVVCGLYTADCVRSTAIGLAVKAGSVVVVAQDACYSPPKRSWFTFPNLYNLVLANSNNCVAKAQEKLQVLNPPRPIAA